MPILHKFYDTNWGNDFATHNAILDTIPYEPEVMFIGTFNPDIPNAIADFFYGRNYFWPAIKNLFIHNNVNLLSRRMLPIGDPPAILDPTLDQVFALCTRLKFTFADMISGVLHHNNPQYKFLANDHVLFNNNEYNLIQDGRNRNIWGLAQLNAMGQVNWNTQNIIKYLCEHSTIKQIYLTRQPNGIWAIPWNTIINHLCVKGRNNTNIYTPAGSGLVGVPRMTVLLHHWVHYIGQRFGRLNNAWLQANEVIPARF